MMLIRKLRSRRALTLTEMLVTVVILGLVSGAVATGMTSAMPVYRQSVALSESAVLVSTLTQAISDELRYARKITTASSSTGDPPLESYTSTLYGANASIVSESGKLLVRCNPRTGSTVAPKDYPLIGSGSYTDLEAESTITYAGGVFNIELTIKQGTKEISTTDFAVRALNA